MTCLLRAMTCLLRAMTCLLRTMTCLLRTMTCLLRTWAALMALTLFMALSADVNHDSRLGAVSIALIVAAVIVKARLVLGVYLGLRVAPAALSGFTSAVVVVLAIVVASFLVFPTPAPRRARQSTTASFQATHPNSAGATE